MRRRWAASVGALLCVASCRAQTQTVSATCVPATGAARHVVTLSDVSPAPLVSGRIGDVVSIRVGGGWPALATPRVSNSSVACVVSTARSSAGAVRAEFLLRHVGRASIFTSDLRPTNAADPYLSARVLVTG